MDEGTDTNLVIDMDFDEFIMSVGFFQRWIGFDSSFRIFL